MSPCRMDGAMYILCIGEHTTICPMPASMTPPKEQHHPPLPLPALCMTSPGYHSSLHPLPSSIFSSSVFSHATPRFTSPSHAPPSPTLHHTARSFSLTVLGAAGRSRDKAAQHKQHQQEGGRQRVKVAAVHVRTERGRHSQAGVQSLGPGIRYPPLPPSR